MKQTLFILLLSLLIIICLGSCYASDLHNGRYTIKSINGDLVEFKEVAGGVYHIPTQGLKVGDRIKLKRVHKQSKITVY